MDVRVIPFKIVDLTRATNPVKVYEYLCVGKPVVATNLPELRLLPDGLVDLADTPAAFEKVIARQLRQPDPALTRRRRRWAARHSWKSRVEKLAASVERLYPLVSVVIVCYNNLSFTKTCLESVVRFSDYPNLEIICVDNASADETPAFLAEMPAGDARIRYIRNDRNLGFAGGNNVGIAAALGAYVILLNNDTNVTRGWVHDLIRPMRLDPSIAMTGPLANMAGNGQKIAINCADMAGMGGSQRRLHRRPPECPVSGQRAGVFLRRHSPYGDRPVGRLG